MGRSFSTVLILLLALTALPGCVRPGERPAPPKGIVLVTIDTLRSDRLGCYGYTRDTSPFIDSLARKGVLFTDAYSSSSWTVPSMASIFTGLYPSSHGVRHGVVEGGNVLHQEALSEDLPSLPAALQRAGYTTFGISSNLHMTRKTGFARGFDHFSALGFATGDEVNEAALAMVDRIDAAQRWFLWVHYFDPHDPYLFRAPWAETYCSTPAICRKISDDSVKMKRLRVMRRTNRRGPYFVSALRDLYDSEINYCDARLRELFQRLPGIADCLVIVTADHGEEFEEHGGLGHGTTLYDELVRVPLILRPPGGRAEPIVHERPASLVDILPTLLDAAGLSPPAGSEGRSLLARGSGPAGPGCAPTAPKVFMELDRKFLGSAVRSDGWKLIDVERPMAGTALYDLAADPGETANLAGVEVKATARLHRALETWRRRPVPAVTPATAAPLSEEELESLQSMGYIE